MFKTIYEELMLSWERQKPKASGWGLVTKNPPWRCATAVAAVKASQAFTPSREGIPRQASAHMQNSDSTF